MVRAALLAVLLLTMAFAGCLRLGALESEAGDPQEPLWLSSGEQTAMAGQALRWTGQLAAEEEDSSCGSSNCMRFPFEVHDTDAASEGTWDLVVTLAWPYDDTRMEFHSEHGVAFSTALELTIVDGGGNQVAQGVASIYASVAVLEGPAAGAYEAQVRAVRGETPFHGSVQLEPRQAGAAGGGAGRDLLPDLVTMPIVDLRIEYPNTFPYGMVVPEPVGEAVTDALGAKGCGLDEVLESQPEKCLRFSNAIANMGEGPLEVRMPVQDGTDALLGQARFTQRIYQSDGGHRDVPAGYAEYHAIHAHFHYSSFAAIDLHVYDLEAQERGALVTSGEKLGYCFFDLGLYDVGLPGTAPHVYGLEGCLDPTEGNAWVNGISPNWYDVYIWALSHQYIDITGVPDGVYELVSVANQDQSVLEASSDGNEASVVFRLQGETVEVLFRPSGEPWWSG